MSSNIVLTVDVREGTGKGAARAARREDLVPGVIYGGELGPVSINLRGNEIRKALLSGNFLSHILELNHDGKNQKVIARDIQFHPVSDMAMHVDMYRVEANTKIRVNVAVRFENEETCPALKRGGVLNIVRHDLELLCPASAIPEYIAVDLTGLEIGDSIHMSAVTLPAGVKPTITRDFTIATLQGSRAVLTELDETEGEDAAEVEEEGGEE
ncbi:50S ribosomal protein L25/general stress protein Ctc [Maricaulis salignorans]|uniref:Large ribosomal subunit protein bL25 n=1 Tax=Maricaulis salignorans TaxID=144026 RepID=A0A1G9MSE1_9PROT|nr:50S ribosomal protein L25/general stress protein Ctc [Maricaulis salignorans]SDL77024.1 large subunit ribosomal protein L25 [Maricaulis salignorans]